MIMDISCPDWVMLVTVSLEPSKPIRLLSIFGTRPEATKMAPVVQILSGDSRFHHILVVTAQHREMLDQVMELFQLKADFDLDIMRKHQSLSQITTRSLTGLDRVIEQIKPDLVLVHGDTTTTFAGALSAYYHQIPVAHVEAGLRSGDRLNPFPEELNRILTDDIADICFAPTPRAALNLRREGIKRNKIFVTGQTAVDALMSLARSLDQRALPPPLVETRPFVLVEVHRRENWGEPLKQVSLALSDIAQQFPQLDLVLSLHKNPAVRQSVLPQLAGCTNLHILEPLPFLDFLLLMKRCLFVVTDSGGVQEEAPSFHKPVLVTRRVTERPEGVWHHVSKIIGTNRRRVHQEMVRLLTDPEEYRRMSQASNPFGDGRAAERIRDYLLYNFHLQVSPPEEFLPCNVKHKGRRKPRAFLD
jgi:UDP-N-acetylglucosamine 2-epimerase (non-hydrolysing)